MPHTVLLIILILVPLVIVLPWVGIGDAIFMSIASHQQMSLSEWRSGRLARWTRDTHTMYTEFNRAQISYHACVDCDVELQSDTSVCPRCGTRQ